MNTLAFGARPDNLPALCFYQRRGHRVSAVWRDSVAAHSRDHHQVARFAGIPILDEIQLVTFM